MTFLFSDVEGSTSLLRTLGDDYREVQDDHMRLMREAIAEGGGTEIRTEGDAFFVAFPTASGAVRAAVAAQRALASHSWTHGRPVRVRMGMHTGEGRLGGDDYLGIDVNRAARIAAAGHGGQVLLSEATRALVEEALPDEVSLLDLGQHRLKDFDAPQRIHQLLIDGLSPDFPPLKSLDVPTNLPAELTSFVGREKEIEDVTRLLEATRLLTLTGPGGSGKTRLAIRAAAEVLDRFPHGVFFVDLAPITEPHLVPGVIASALGTGERGRTSVMDTLEIELRHRTMLLVLDNFEQVIEAASNVAALLAAAPKIRFLVTSRGPLRIQGEREFPVPPLLLPDRTGPTSAEDLTRYEAPALFVERATAIDPRFTLTAEVAGAIAEICRRLDGLPLAIELAASRLRLLTPTAMLERLDRALPLLAGGARDLPARQRTLRGAIGWSYDLLPPPLGGLFRRVCVFAGGFSLAAVGSVCDPEAVLDVETMESLEALLDSGLVRRRPATDGAVRFETLQTVREFGVERLEELNEGPAVRRRHAGYFVELAEAAAPELRGPEIEGYMGLLEMEHDNLRAALAWAIANDEADVGMRLIVSLWRFWELHGDLTSSRRWADQVLDLPSAAPRTALRAKALIAAGSLAYWQLDIPAVKALYGKALVVSREVGDPAGIAEATYNFAYVPSLEKNETEAAALFRSSQAMFEELGDQRGIADSLFGLSIMTRLEGQLATARATAEEALRLHEELGDILGVHGDWYVLGRAAAEMGDLVTARRRFLQTLDMGERMGYPTGVALSLDELADVAINGGNPIRGMRLIGAADAIKESVGGEAPPELIRVADPRELARKVLNEEEIRSAWEEGRAMTREEALAYAREDA